MKLERDHKIAFARIITDLIEADFIVETDEMQFFEHLISKDGFAISESMLVESKKIDFAKALSILNLLDLETRKSIVEILKKLSMSDGVCVPLEAIIIYAVEQVLLNGAVVHSIPDSKININNLKVIYIENEESGVSEQIENNLYYITNELRLAGFDFVYIPSLAKDFRMMEYDYLKKVVKYMIPSISNERVETICENLRELTTAKFCRELLYKKLGINIIDSKPSLLIKINESDIIDKNDSDEAERIRFCNFLQIKLGDDALNEIHNHVELYHSMINCSITIENKPRIAKFVYAGFHRSLFDLIAFGYETKEYRLVFDFKKHKLSVYFESVDDENERIILKLNPQEATLYLMIAKRSLMGERTGLDWREHIPAKDKELILKEYNQIYNNIGRFNSVTEYKDRTQVHHIKNRIRTLQSIANSEMFIPIHIKDGNKSYYKIRAISDYVVIKGSISNDLSINTTL